MTLLCLALKRCPKHFPSPLILRRHRFSSLLIVRVILAVELVLVEVDGGDLPAVKGAAGQLLDRLSGVGGSQILEEDLGQAGTGPGDDDVLQRPERAALVLGVLHDLLVVL
eukprot:CAMPEP_0185821142 /NCGR_PEP_ID=MMETSP1322-20130828/24763_1 /TAXON_ID=265543 /ORGANISM="Minutocellus polymorphus, Strain RCC2270" /LENGTH=110 /DNA_ID=CAMNT_0028518501 /DNA_START=170 /DNA_END=499 /DNA_ORIENTATION=-